MGGTIFRMKCCWILFSNSLRYSSNVERCEASNLPSLQSQCHKARGSTPFVVFDNVVGREALFIPSKSVKISEPTDIPSLSFHGCLFWYFIPELICLRVLQGSPGYRAFEKILPLPSAWNFCCFEVLVVDRPSRIFRGRVNHRVLWILSKEPFSTSLPFPYSRSEILNVCMS